MSNFRRINTEKLSLSLVDDLTQLCNRRFIYNNMPKIITEEEAFSKKTSVLMIDVDNFKNINDTFGHLVGDMILMELARVMKKSVADNGIVARYAGDEFLILLPGMDEDQAYKIGESILKDSSEFKWSTKDRDFKGQGLSIGVAAYPDDSVSMADLINCADQALYAAKKAGKNRIFHYKSVGEEIKNRIMVRQMLLRPPLVNRSEELGKMKEHYKISESGKKQSILLQGEPGTGKTRLLGEFAGWTEGQNVLFLFCKLEQKQDGGPLAALTELLRLLANLLGEDEFRDILAKLSPPELAEVLYLYPAAKKLIKNASVNNEPERRAKNIFSALCKIVVSAAREKTLVLVVDDINRANQITLQFFSTILGFSGIKKFLFIGAYGKEKAEDLKDLLATGVFTAIKLRPLEKDEVSQLIISIFHGIEFEPKQMEDIFTASKGNPLLLCEILRNLVEKGHIQYKDGRWRLTDIGTEDIPDSLSDAAEHILRGLDDETREMLSMAAIMGGKVELDTLERFGGYKEGYLMELLDRATKAGIIRLPDPSCDSLSFSTESVRKIIADKVTAQKADLVHHKLAELIKQEYKDELPGQLDRLIYHLDLAKEDEAASKYKNIRQKLIKEFSLPAKLTDILEKQKETPVSIEELLEKPLSEASTRIAKDAILALRAAAIGTLLYPAGNSMRIDLENRAYQIMVKILKNDPTLTFSNTEGKILVNGYVPKHIDAKNIIGFTLISLMEDYGINSITFKRDLGQEEFAYFLYYLSNPEGDIAALLREKGVSHIKIDQVRYEKLSDVTMSAGGRGWVPSIAELTKDSLLDMPLEQYFDPKVSNKMDLIAEALILAKNNEKIKSIVDRFSEGLNAGNIEDESAIAEGAIKLGESLLVYEKSDLLEILIKAMLNRFNDTKQLKEFTKLCDGLQTMAVHLIDKGSYSQAGTIINNLKAQITADSKRAPEQKKIVEDGLHKIAHPKVVEALMTAFRAKLRSGDPTNITDILESLGEYALDSMLDILTQEEPREKDPFELFVIRNSVAMMLKKIGQPAEDALKRMLNTSKRSHVIRNVIEMFGYIGNKEFVPLIAPFLDADSLQVRRQCVVTLKKIGTTESLKILIEALKDKSDDIKQAAALAIEELADDSFINELNPLLKNKSAENMVRGIIQKIQTKKKK